jgi:hypothetical protein
MHGISVSANSFVFIIFGATIGGIFGYSLWRDARSRRRIAAGQCVRCGMETVDPVDLTRTEVGPQVPLLMCERCATRTRQNHRAAYWLFLTFCGIGLGAVVFGMSSDLRRGVHYSFWDFVWLPGMILIPGLALLRIFRRGLDRDNG